MAIVGVIALFTFITSLRGLAGFWTDYLWFDALGFGAVFRRILWARIGLGLLFTGVFFGLLYVNLWVADRLGPTVRPKGPEEDLVERYHAVVGQRTNLVRFVISAVFALIAGVGVSSQWENWLLFTNRVDFGVSDAQFEKDVGFYVFQLPFLTYVVGWLFAAILIIFIVTAVAHYLNGGIRIQQPPAKRVSAAVKGHLSLLLGLLALVKAAGYYFDQFELTLSTRGFVDGASYADVNAQLPAIRLLIIISLFSFALLIFNIWRRGFTYPIIAVGLWALVAMIAGTAYPAIVQRFQVDPNESQREEIFIERNIAATRLALGIDAVTERSFDYSPELTASQITDNIDTVTNVRLLDPGIIGDTFNQLQGIRGFYNFGDVDVDRYEIDGRTTQVVLSARELLTSGLPNSSWESEHVAFTHGYGIAVAPANGVNANGRPEFVVGDIPTRQAANAPDLQLEEPGLYFGEGLGGYALVGAERDETDYQQVDDTTAETRYDGEGGVSVGGIFRRAAFALRFADPNLVISGQIQGSSRVIYIRDIRSRVEELAPFLAYDADPYPIVLEGRIQWVVDAYTTTDRYPYGERADTSGLVGGSGLNRRFNYVRNSVKIVVDAYHGSVDFYIIDESDPLAQSYKKMFPALFANGAPSAELASHFRYPEDLFRVQTNMWGRYRIGNPSEFYDASGRWAVAQDPGDIIGQVQTQAVLDEAGVVIGSTEKRIDPQYLLMRLPNDAEESFLMFRPFVPFSQEDERRNLQGFMVAHSDPGRYGEIEVFEVPSDLVVDGPTQFNSNIQTEVDISREITLLNGNGSQVRQGNLLLIPIENSIIYVRPLFVEATTGTAVPEVQQVIVGLGDSIIMRPTLEEALSELIPGLDISLIGGLELTPLDPADPVPDPDDPPDTTTPPVTAPTGDETAAELLDLAAAAFNDADAALRAGDLAGYQAAVTEAEGLIAQARELLGRENDVPSVTTTTASA